MAFTAAQKKEIARQKEILKKKAPTGEKAIFKKPIEQIEREAKERDRRPKRDRDDEPEFERERMPEADFAEQLRKMQEAQSRAQIAGLEKARARV